MTTLAYAQLGTLLLTTALAAPADNQVPFKGQIQTAEVLDLSGFPTDVTSSAVGEGNATELGQFSVTWLVHIDFTAAIPEAVGEGVFTAANGDTLFTHIVGVGYPTAEPNVLSIVEEQTIVGGTGRFEGATGKFTRRSLSNLVTGLSSGSFSGTISIPGQS